MAHVIHCVSSSDADSDDEFRILPDLATRLKQAREGNAGGATSSVTSHASSSTSYSSTITSQGSSATSCVSSSTSNSSSAFSSINKAHRGKSSARRQSQSTRPLQHPQEDCDGNKENKREQYTDEEEISFVEEINNFGTNTGNGKFQSSVIGADPWDDLPDLAPHHRVAAAPAPSTVVTGRAKASALSLPTPSQHITSPPPSIPPPPLHPLSKAEEKRIQAERKRREVDDRKRDRDRLKRQRQDEKDRAKEMKELDKVAKKADSLAECTKWLLVVVPHAVCSSAAGQQLLPELQQTEMQHRVDTDPLIPGALTMARVDPRTKREQPEDHALVVLEARDLVQMVRNQLNGTSCGIGATCTGTQCTCSGTLDQHVVTWKNVLNVNNLTLLVWALDQHFKGRKGARGSGGRLEPDRLAVESCLTSLMLSHRCCHRQLADALQLAQGVVQTAKAVGQAPYKRELQSDSGLFSSWFAESSNVCPVKVTGDGVGLRKLWSQQIRQFTSVGLETAQTIAQAYPSPSLLIQAYRDCPPSDAPLLLADLPILRGSGPLQTNRRLGPELSRKVHQFFTDTRPDRVLGSV